MIHGCAFGTPDLEVGSSELISPASSNYVVTTNWTQPTAAYSASEDQWVVAYTVPSVNGSNQHASIGWAYSSDGTGSSWTQQTMTAHDDFGAVGNGWVGEPSIAPVTDPILYNNGASLVMAGIGAASTTGDPDDVVVAWTNDGGRSWKNAPFVNNSVTGDDVEHPVVVSNGASPYHTFVVWTAESGSGREIQIRRIEYSSTGTFSRGASLSAMPTVSSTTRIHPNISAAMGQYENCDGETHEAVFVTYARTDATIDECPMNGSPNKASVDWRLAIYDVDEAKWQISEYILKSDGAFPYCVGSGYTINNDPGPQIAVDFSNHDAKFWVTHTQSSGYGTRLDMRGGAIICNDGAIEPSPSSGFTPAICRPNQGGCNSDGSGFEDASGDPDITDTWGTTIAFAAGSSAAGVPRLVLTYQGTHTDPSSNKFATTYAIYSEDLSTYSNYTPVSVGTGVPWNQASIDWGDYQALGVNPVDGAFLSVWAGDTRDSTPRMYSGLLD